MTLLSNKKNESFKRRSQQAKGTIGNKNNRYERDQAGENITQRQEILHGTCQHPPKDDTGSHSHYILSKVLKWVA